MNGNQWAIRLGFWCLAFILLLALSMAVSISIGSADIGVADVWSALIGPSVSQEIDPVTEAIIREIRLPRVLLAALVGAALAAAGTVFQGLLKNPLADPYILGVSSGAAVGAAVAIFTGWGMAWLGRWTVPLWAFALGAVALVCVLALARVGSTMRRETLILSGVVVQAFFGAILTYVIATVSAQEMQRIQFWLMGSVALRDWSHAMVIVPFLAGGLLLSWLLSRSLNLFALGERSAAHVGVSVERVRLTLLVTATLMTAAAVSVAGTIGFVGLVIPHLMRMFTGPDHRVLLPVASLAGAVFLVWADTFARSVMDPRELPIGVVTALIGAPFFAWQLRRYTRRAGEESPLG
ncbi:FecCD family ABC transporter permease [Desmospora profundinema]|uniref:Iron complex transport system permease protein n=1 Tax=Desmospora profundinema TaxID=1571184 RepID=A0ABU1IPP3_9BACL|nr:iron ABC transporter permease [Desmospora profundinema]MDR6225914.1 iron complex transport system permease protein [Desmospora profundinema]